MHTLHLWGLRHSFYSRFIFTCISSGLYYKDKTVDGILAEFSKQARCLFEDGFVETWPFLRKRKLSFPFPVLSALRIAMDAASACASSVEKVIGFGKGKHLGGTLRFLSGLDT